MDIHIDTHIYVNVYVCVYVCENVYVYVYRSMRKSEATTYGPHRPKMMCGTFSLWLGT